MLRVDYEGLANDTIPKMKKCEQNIAAVYSDMNAAVGSLVQYMEANAANSYINEFRDLIGPSVEKMEELVRDYHTQLQSVVDHFSEVDSQISSQIGF
ncbi:MAG: hypothetical protein IJ040_05305 [Lachnospiraceae bacterium]|nr:hypothetical protein [Lachnospiraceae bacterium]